MPPATLSWYSVTYIRCQLLEGMYSKAYQNDENFDCNFQYLTNLNFHVNLMDAFKNLRLSLQLFKVCLVGTPNLYLKVTVQRCKTRNQSE